MANNGLEEPFGLGWRLFEDRGGTAITRTTLPAFNVRPVELFTFDFIAPRLCASAFKTNERLRLQIDPEVVAVDRQAFAEIETVRLFALHSGVELQLDAAALSGFALQPIHQHLAVPT